MLQHIQSNFAPLPSHLDGTDPPSRCLHCPCQSHCRTHCCTQLGRRPLKLRAAAGGAARHCRVQRHVWPRHEPPAQPARTCPLAPAILQRIDVSASQPPGMLTQAATPMPPATQPSTLLAWSSWEPRTAPLLAASSSPCCLPARPSGAARQRRWWPASGLPPSTSDPSATPEIWTPSPSCGKRQGQTLISLSVLPCKRLVRSQHALRCCHLTAA